MSVIFNTLKKLRSQSPDEKKTGRLKKGRNVYSFRRILFSPSSILLIVLFIFISGLAAIYGVRYIRDSMHEKRRKPVVKHASIKTAPVPRDVKPEQLEPDNNTVPVDIPPPPDVIPVAETEPKRPAFTAAPVERPVSKPPVYARYSPRKQNSITSEKSIEKKGRLLPAQEITGPTGDEIQEIQDGQASINEAEYLPKSAKTGDIAAPVAGMDNNVIVPPVAPQKLAHFQSRGAPELEGETVLPKRDGTDLQKTTRNSQLATRNSVYAPVQERALQTRRPKEIEAEKPEKEKIHLADVNKSAEITRLVARLHKSIDRADDAQAEELLGQLTALKGEDNIYVMKLRAFLHIRNQDYESAALLLEKVLESDGRDLEAGINMAVVEIKTNRIQDARKRLAKLREIYSDNIFIPELMRKLK
jgi:tetratricopeptide (TPR) repeat protein